MTLCGTTLIAVKCSHSFPTVYGDVHDNGNKPSVPTQFAIANLRTEAWGGVSLEHTTDSHQPSAF